MARRWFFPSELEDVELVRRKLNELVETAPVQLFLDRLVAAD